MKRPTGKRRAFKATAPDAPYAIRPEAFGFLFLSASAEPNELTEGGVAIVNIQGPLEQRAGWFDGYDAIRTRFEEALADENAHTVLLRIDSPGGEVAGMFEAVNAMRAAKDASGKRVVAYADEGAFSAAYTLATVADEVYVPASGGVGSCGVITSVVDFSVANERAGVNVAVITSGVRKTDGHPDVPLTEQAIATISKRIATLAEQLFATVAVTRPISADEVRALEAACLYGDDAVASGLADGVIGFDALLASLESESGKAKEDQPGAAPTKEGKAMLKKKNGAAALIAAATIGATVEGHTIEALHAKASEKEDASDEEKDEDAEDEKEKESDEGNEDDEEASEDDDEEEKDEDAEEDCEDEKAATPIVPTTAGKTTTRDVLAAVRQVTGKQSPAEQLGALAALAGLSAEVVSLRGRLAKVEARDTKRNVEAVVAKAIKAGKLTPAQKAWAIKTGMRDLGILTGFIEASAPRVAPVEIGAGDGEKQKAPTLASIAGTGSDGLTDVERNIARAMQLDPKEVAKTKAEIDPKRGILPVVVH